MSKVLHIAMNRKNARNKFVPDFRKLLKEQGIDNDFIYIGDNAGIDNEDSVKIYKPNAMNTLKLAIVSFKYNKVILHSLPPSIFIFFMLPLIFLTKKFYLIIWGGEIHHRKYNKVSLTSRIGDLVRYLCLRSVWGVITDIDGDYKIIKEKYKNKGIRVNLSSLYPSNIFYEADDYSTNRHPHPLKILIGASAAKRNNHEYILNLIKDIPISPDTTFICPLSYGDNDNAKTVEKQWKDIFGESFHPIFEFMDLVEYKKLLADIDIALFAFDGQQALGNIRNLLGYGCKVYLKKSSIAFQHFHDKGLDVYDIDEFTGYECERNKKNSEIIKVLYSYNNTANKVREFLLD